MSDVESANFADFSHLEDEEAQVQAIFNEALALKRQVRELSLSLTESESKRQNDTTKIVHLIREKDEATREMNRRSEDAVSLRAELMSTRSSLQSEIQNLKVQLQEKESEAMVPLSTAKNHTDSPVMLAMQGKIALLETEVKKRDMLLRSSAKVTTRTVSTQTHVEQVAKESPLLVGEQEQRREPVDQRLRLSVIELLHELRNLKNVTGLAAIP